MRIAFHLLYSNGDCLFGTTLVRQLKEDYPHAEIIWHISEQAKGMALNNPDVSEIVTYDIKKEPGDVVWARNEEKLKQDLAAGRIDKLVSPQIIGDNERHYTGTIRSTILKQYHKGPLSAGTRPFLYMSADEKKSVEAFANQNNLSSFNKVVLFECMPLSGQVPMNPDKALNFCERIIESGIKDVCFILTSGQKITSKYTQIVDASVLTIRENYELLKSVDLVIGCSSGISWMSFAHGLGSKPMFQLMDNKSFYFNSFHRDCRILHEDSQHIAESLYISDEQVYQNIYAFVTDTQRFLKNHQDEIPDRSRTLYSLSRRHLLAGKYGNVISLLKNSYHLNKKNIHYYRTIINLIIKWPLLFWLYIRGDKVLKLK